VEEEYSKAVGKRNCRQEILTWSEQISIGEVDCTKVMTNTEWSTICVMAKEESDGVV